MNSIDIEEWFKGFNKFFREIKNDVEVIVCPSYVDIVKCSQQAPNLIMAAQDVSIHDDGPFTGQISALQLSRTSEQLKYCLLGHSEVRSKGDTNSLIRIKSKKLEALKEYDSEMRDWPHARSIKAIDYKAKLRGSQLGVNAVEAFKLLRNSI